MNKTCRRCGKTFLSEYNSVANVLTENKRQYNFYENIITDPKPVSNNDDADSRWIEKMLSYVNQSDPKTDSKPSISFKSEDAVWLDKMLGFAMDEENQAGNGLKSDDDKRWLATMLKHVQE